MDRYDPSAIEPKWQAYWDEKKTFKTPETPQSDKKAYILDMFPYPSGSGLHVGHPEGYTATDIVARYKRAIGYDVLHPMGWDAFGLPAEQHAIQTGTHPRETTQENIATFKRQLKMLGFSYDWDREIDTTDPEYVRWTQWIFLELFDRGLAYQSEIPVNWCPALGTVLANEEIINGLSERGGHPVIRTPIRQWMLRITAYAEKLLEGLDLTEWPSSTRTMQIEWIGRSEGAEVRFETLDGESAVEVYTTRPDTLFGCTFVVLAPEHPLVEKLISDEKRAEAEAYIEAAKAKSERDRQASKEKTGVFIGGFVRNPVNDEEVPVFIADYVLAGYGTGAIMAVPAHDQRDFEFAKAFGLPIREVVSKSGEPSAEPLEEAMVLEGIAVNSGKYNGLKTAEFKAKITDDLERAGKGKRRVETKLRDWVFSRQRYWGEPIPIYFPVETEGDPRKGDPYTIDYSTPIPVPREELPLKLPELDDFRPGEDPAGVLARAVDWRFFEKDGKFYARETNTMPQWAGSCWYYLRFIDPHNQEAPFSMEAAKRWLPVDLYVGGAEHAVLHLLYARFWHKVLYDAGIVPVPEPFQKLVHQGMILGEIEYTAFRKASGELVSAREVKSTADGEIHEPSGEAVTREKVAAARATKDDRGEWVLEGEPSIALEARAHKMSKSRGNVVNPDEIVREFGADAMRVYEMFMGPLEATKPWNTASIGGVRRFLDRAYQLAKRSDASAELSAEQLQLVHQTIKKVTEDIEALHFNTAISALMVLSNELNRLKAVPREAISIFARLLHPFAPHLGEEMWEMIGEKESVQLAPWPEYDASVAERSEVEIPVQILGKVRGRITIAKDADQDEVLAKAKELPQISSQLDGKTIRKVIYVPGKILNLIVG